MTEDQLIRAAATAASIPVYMWLIQKAKSYLARKRDESGRTLPERIGYIIGGLWARGNKRVKNLL
jgi:hypothetical protein